MVAVRAPTLKFALTKADSPWGKTPPRRQERPLRSLTVYLGYGSGVLDLSSCMTTRNAMNLPSEFFEY